ncbi:ABC transporter ATP-binding protein [Oceanivirga salmonicida]|uniref:ABC transporter ATP-binding protein n=1 Tax=Oceanivirga salmonicida TaxID=1769291 RepID=UPI000832D282|nr:ABC transporter ATP-binding protein [Oceanivirga salmonicida]
MIVIKNLTKRFGKKKAVNNLNVEIKDGTVVAFIGHNGAGKTTTLNMMSGILPIDEGEIILNGKTIKDKDYKREFTVVFDNPDHYLYLTAMEYFQFITDIYEVDKDEVETKITNLANEFGITEVLHENIESFSHGMRQKVMIIGALLVNPNIWILDEPLTGLDPIASFKLKELMKEHARKGNIVLFSTHVLEVAEKLCDSIIIIKEGSSIFQGTLEQIKQNYPDKNLEEIFLTMMGVSNNGQTN